MRPTFLRFGAAVLLLSSAPFAGATVVGPGAFPHGVRIDFNDGNPVNTVIGNLYQAQGLAYTNLCGGQVFSTGPAPASEVASNFFEPGCGSGRVFNAKQLSFAAPLLRVGFDITTNDADDTTVTAYLGDAIVGEHTFDTFGAGAAGTFLGIEFAGGFDRIDIAPLRLSGGAFAIDNLVFEYVEVPAPPAMLLLGFAGLAACLRRRRTGPSEQPACA